MTTILRKILPKRRLFTCRDSECWYVSVWACVSTNQKVVLESRSVDHLVTAIGGCKYFGKCILCLSVPLSQQILVIAIALQPLELQRRNLAGVSLEPKCRSSPKMGVVWVRILTQWVGYSGQCCHTHLWRRGWCNLIARGLWFMYVNYYRSW